MLKTYSLTMSRRELHILQRLVGHHTLGGGLTRIYDQLHDMSKDAQVYSEDALPRPTFPDSRTVVDVTGQGKEFDE